MSIKKCIYCNGINLRDNSRIIKGSISEINDTEIVCLDCKKVVYLKNNISEKIYTKEELFVIDKLIQEKYENFKKKQKLLY